MIRTLRITSVVAVILAAVVLASVLGFLRPTPFLHLNPGTGGDKRTETILSGPSAVDRFKEKFGGGKVPDGQDTTPPLVKQATLLEGIINPREDGSPKPTQRNPLTAKPIPIKPAQSSAKFDLLGICYSSDAKTSLAYIRLPDKDNTYQWVGPGSEIGHVTIKEIRRNSIVYMDGSRDVEMQVVAPPETASLLEADNASATPGPSLPRPGTGTKATASPVKPSVSASSKAAPGAASPKTVPATTSAKTASGATVPPAQISKEEQENLSQLGDKLQSGTGASAAERDALNNKLISEYKSAQVNPTEADKVENPGETSTAGNDPSKAAMREESRRQYLKKLSKPRTNMK